MRHQSQILIKVVRTLNIEHLDSTHAHSSQLLRVRNEYQQSKYRTLSIAATCVINSCRMNGSFSDLSDTTKIRPSFKSRSVLCTSNSLPSIVPTSTYSKFTAVTNLGGHVPLCEERAHDLISNLKDSERAAIKTALAKYEALKLKEAYEGKLAATQWRTRFGRLSRVPASTLGNVDPTGSYCAFPNDWLRKKAVEQAPEPTRSDLMTIFMVNAVPFVGFGFLDNFTMIIAGEYIEHIFGYFMCISTMAAAGLGNTISDVLGIGSAYYVERGCQLLGLKPPDLTPWQFELKSSRRAANYGRMIGITIGCLIGMTPLLFMNLNSKEEDEKAVKKSGK